MKVLLLGDLPIATKVCQFLEKQSEIVLEGVVIGNRNPTNNDPWPDVPLLSAYVEKNDIRVYTLRELPRIFDEKSLHMGFSCRFSRILKKEHIDLFKHGIVNFHGGLIPEFGGLYSSCHTILEEAEVGGGTLHFINEEIDKGNIISRAEINISKEDTSFTVFQRTQQALFDEFVDIFKKLINQKVQLKQLKTLIEQGHPDRYFNNRSLNGKKKIQLDSPEKLIDKKVRAFDFPNKEPAFFKINNKKYFVRTDK